MYFANRGPAGMNETVLFQRPWCCHGKSYWILRALVLFGTWIQLLDVAALSGGAP